MNQNPPWLKFFKIDPSEFQMVQKNQIASLTAWCLKQGKISAKNYLKWAREYYKLASIEDSFFQTHSSFLSLFKKYKDFPWSEYCLPIAEWEGILFVACVEPPRENWNVPVRFFLTSNENLEKLWALFKKNFSELNQQKISETMQDQNLVHSSGSKENPQSKLKEGNLENIDSKWIHPSPAPSKSTLETQNLPQKMKLELKEQSFPKNNESNIKTENLTAPKPQKGPSEEENKPSEAEGTSKNVETAIEINESEGSKAISLEPFAMSSFHDEIHDIKALVQWVFEQMNPFFSHCLWFFLKENHFFCWRYTSNLTPQNPNQLIDYTQPSIFRIVFRTGLPYHGYTTSSSVNDQFFENWGFEAHPEHITTFPIKDDETCIGLLMGIGDSNSNTEKALNQTEKIVEKITQVFKKLKISIQSIH